MSFIKIIALTFAAPPTTASRVILKYRKVSTDEQQWIPVNGGNEVIVPLSGILTTPIIINNLLIGEQYEVSAQLVSCGGSEVISTITTPANVFVCTTVTNLVVSELTPTTAIISWTGVTGATKYQYRLNDGDISEWFDIGLTNSILLKDLRSAIAHTFSIRAIHDKITCLNKDVIFTTPGRPSGLIIENRTTSSYLTYVGVPYAAASKTLPLLPTETLTATITLSYEAQVHFTIEVEECVAYLYKNSILIESLNARIGSNNFSFLRFETTDSILLVLKDNKLSADCAEPANLMVTGQAPTTALIAWDRVPNASGYVCALDGGPWIEVGNNKSVTLYDLSASAHAVKVRAIINSIRCTLFGSINFTMPIVIP